MEVHHRLQVQEEEDKGRKVEQEIEREHSREDDHGDDMKGLNTRTMVRVRMM